MSVLNALVKQFKTIIAIDTAKNSFQACVARTDGEGKPKQYKFTRAKFLESIVQFGSEGTLIVMEACSASHHWGREFQKAGFTVKLIAPKHTKKFLKNSRMKNDANDAEAILTCTIQHNSRFMRVKTVEESSIDTLHTTRDACVRNRVEAGNRLRGCAAEYGIVVEKGAKNVAKLLELIDSDELLSERGIPEDGKWVLRKLAEIYRSTLEQENSVTDMLTVKAKENDLVKRLMTCPGIGPVIASAIVAKVSDASEFENGRQLAAFFGMAPCQNSTGGRNTLGGISKTGDPYIRKLISQGAQVVVRFAKHHQDKHTDDQLDRFAARLIEHGKPRTKVVIAVAAKMVRTVWAMLRHGTDYTPVMQEA